MKNSKDVARTLLPAIAATLFLGAVHPAFGRDGDKSSPSPAASSPATATVPRPVRGKRVITNDDMDILFPRHEPSVVQLPSPTPSSSGTATSAMVPGSAASRTRSAQAIFDADEARYSAKFARLSAELEDVTSRERSLREFRSTGSGENLRFGLQIYAPCEGFTTDNQIQQLAIRRNEINRQIEDLETEAQQKGLPPGIFRQTPEILESPNASANSSQQLLAIHNQQERLANELNGVQSELSEMSNEAAQQGIAQLPADAKDGGNMTSNLINDLNNRANHISAAIDQNEDLARSAGVTSPSAP
jgi:hypothetical protein